MENGNEIKCYIFECECSCKATISIWADDKDTALDYLNNKQWDEEETFDLNVENVLDYRVEEQ